MLTKLHKLFKTVYEKVKNLVYFFNNDSEV